MRQVILLLALFPLTVACAPISEDECRIGDWRGIGVADGVKGLSVGRVGDYAETCAEFGISPNLAAYQAGRAEGLITYCTPQNAYQIGRRGNRINAVCTAKAMELMVPANNKGLNYFEIVSDIERIEDRIDTLQEILAADFSGTLTEAQEIEAAGIRADIRSLKSKRFSLSLDRRRYASWP